MQTKIFLFRALNQPRKHITNRLCFRCLRMNRILHQPQHLHSLQELLPTVINLPTFPEFELQPRDTAPTRFEKYVKRLNNIFTAMSITQASRKKAMLLLHYVGEETCDVLETLTVPEPTEGSDEYQTAVKAFADYFEPQKCVDHHVYISSLVWNCKSLVRTSLSSTLVFNCWHANVSSPIPTWK